MICQWTFKPFCDIIKKKLERIVFMRDKLLKIGEYALAGLYEEPERSLFYRKSLGLRRYFENCELAKYTGKPLYPSGTIKQKMLSRLNYMYALEFRGGSTYPEIAKRLNEDFGGYRSTVPKEHTVAGDMYTHSMPNYERFLSEGLLSYLPRIEKIADKDMRDGLRHLVEGIIRYTERCADHLESVGAEEKLVKMARKIPLYPAENIEEAIFGWNFILYLDNCDNLGCLGKGLTHYFKGENIVPLLENLYDNLDENEGYSMSILPDCPKELAVMLLLAAKGKRRPMIELFVDDTTPDEVWRAALETVKSGGGQPAFYNPNVLLRGLEKRFPIKDGDIRNLCGGGCTEMMISGYSNVGSLDAGINLPLILEYIIKGKLADAKNFDEFYECYVDEARRVTEKVKKEISNSRESRAKYSPLPMRTLLMDDCIDNGRDYNDGGARYNWSIINFAGMINVIDSLLAIKQLVFDSKKYSAAEIVKLLSENDENLAAEVKRLPKSFGKDDAEVNEFAYEFSKTVFAFTNEGELYEGLGFLSSSIQFMSQVGAGKNVGATPDGRRCGEPLCDSLAAIFGKDTLGPTALLNSVAALDLKSALGTPVVNFNLQKNCNDDVLKALIMGYMKQGGVQLQITCASREELLDACEHPENHGNLIVRVGGYSEYFTRLSKELQKMVIDRTIQSEI